MKIEINNLRTVANYAKAYNGKGVSVQYIYKLIRLKKVDTVKIDGITFVSK